MPPLSPSTSVKSVCGNSRGISLLSVAGKVLALVTLQRLLTHVAETVLPESQCGFRRGHSTTDMIYVARLLQEKCREQHRHLFFAFIDLTKAFDTVNRELLWEVLSKFGCTPRFLTILREFHDGMTAKVIIGGQESDHLRFLLVSSKAVFSTSYYGRQPASWPTAIIFYC